MNIQNGFGTELTQMIIQQTREYLDGIARSASQTSDITTAGPIKNTGERSFGGVLDDALYGPAARPSEDNIQSTKSTIQTITTAAPIQDLGQIGNFLAALLLTGIRGSTVHGPATLDQPVGNLADSDSDGAQSGPMASDAPESVQLGPELNSVSTSSSGDTSPKPIHQSSDPNADNTGHSSTETVPSFSTKDVFTGIARNPETGMLSGFYLPGTPRPEKISPEYDWAYTDIGWELRPTEHHPSMQA